MSVAPEGYAVERVQRFPEPAFGRIVRSLLRGSAVDWDALAPAPERRRARARRGAFRPVYTLRIAAFAGDELVGCSYAWQDGADRLYMALSAVLPAHRRRGLYTAMLRMVIDVASADGFAEITSRHRPDNQAVLLAKLRAGFVITGYETSATFGDLVRLTLPLTPSRRRVMQRRMAPPVRRGSSISGGRGARARR
jgi:ribosomal protein S18 acetylase RimI-like enzyme